MSAWRARGAKRVFGGASGTQRSMKLVWGEVRQTGTVDVMYAIVSALEFAKELVDQPAFTAARGAFDDHVSVVAVPAAQELV